jgi:hypothetical protein
MHSKIYLFSRGHVVMEGSANLTGLSMKGQFNELFVSNNLGLYRQFRKLFYLMRRDRPSGYRTFSTGPFMIQAYPASVRRSNDPIMRTLNACLNHRLSRVVWNGSTNWSSGSARRDDIMTRIHGTGTYRQYKALYDWTNRQYRQ